MTDLITILKKASDRIAANVATGTGQIGDLELVNKLDKMASRTESVKDVADRLEKWFYSNEVAMSTIPYMDFMTVVRHAQGKE